MKTSNCHLALAAIAGAISFHGCGASPSEPAIEPEIVPIIVVQYPAGLSSNNLSIGEGTSVDLSFSATISNGAPLDYSYSIGDDAHYQPGSSLTVTAPEDSPETFASRFLAVYLKASDGTHDATKKLNFTVVDKDKRTLLLQITAPGITWEATAETSNDVETKTGSGSAQVQFDWSRTLYSCGVSLVTGVEGSLSFTAIARVSIAGGSPTDTVVCTKSNTQMGGYCTLTAY